MNKPKPATDDRGSVKVVQLYTFRYMRAKTVRHRYESCNGMRTDSTIIIGFLHNHLTNTVVRGSNYRERVAAYLHQKRQSIDNHPVRDIDSWLRCRKLSCINNCVIVHRRSIGSHSIGREKTKRLQQEARGGDLVRLP